MDAVLLLGPTGVGKSPLGDVLEACGLGGRRCHHFDFGANLRRAAADPSAAPGLDEGGHAVIRRVLAEGTLLEDHEWPIAETLLRDFLAGRNATPDDCLVLNGLPRHRGQAEAMETQHRVRAVIALTAPMEVILERIERDTGGDRGARTDDAPQRVRERLVRYDERTRPLLKHYRRLGVSTRALEVGSETTAEDAFERLRELLTDVLGGRA